MLLLFIKVEELPEYVVFKSFVDAFSITRAAEHQPFCAPVSGVPKAPQVYNLDTSQQSRTPVLICLQYGFPLAQKAYKLAHQNMHVALACLSLMRPMSFEHCVPIN